MNCNVIVLIYYSLKVKIVVGANGEVHISVQPGVNPNKPTEELNNDLTQHRSEQN